MHATGTTRPPGRPCCPPPDRWPAGTLAAAGTIPALTMNVTTTLVVSQGHHPANNRSVIPTRAYESGSGHGHDAAPAGRLPLSRSPPVAGVTAQPPPPAPPAARALRVAPRRVLRPRPCPAETSAGGTGKNQRAGHRPARQAPAVTPATSQQPGCQLDQKGSKPLPSAQSLRRNKSFHVIPNQARHLQSLDGPFHMS